MLRPLYYISTFFYEVRFSVITDSKNDIFMIRHISKYPVYINFTVIIKLVFSNLMFNNIIYLIKIQINAWLF